MDVAIGHCWRCENAITREVNCRQCGVAKYCSDTCCRRDQYRHQPECEEWRPKRCSNPTCTSDSRQALKECTSCNEASYCGKVCQKAQWKDHKHKCRERAHEIRTKGAALQSYFQQQCFPGLVPYYFGNALAIDMLNLHANECKMKPKPENRDPLKSNFAILSAGCGNLRNWAHTVASLPAEFSGKLHTVLNDFDPFVQARNVLQLYMMVIYQDEANIATSITNIWYSLKISEKDYNLVVACLTTLQDLTSSNLREVTGGVIQLTEADMAPMREVWQSWLNLECRKGHPNYIDLQEQRRDVFRNSPNAAEGIDVYKKELPGDFVPSYNDYLATGNFQPFGSKRVDLQYDNPTLTGYMFPYDRYDAIEAMKILASPKKVTFVYCIGVDLTPFGSWDYLKVKKNHYHRSMIVMFHGYITDQIQQVMRCLKAGHLTVSFIVWNCLELSARLDQESCKCDRIFTSNIADYSGTQPLLKVMKPFLNHENKSSTIVTQYWNWYLLFPCAKIEGPVSVRASRTKILAECSIAAIKDTCIDIVGEAPFNNPLFMSLEMMKTAGHGPYFWQEYFNYTKYFVSYLRAEFMAFNQSLGGVSDDVWHTVHMQRLFEFSGLKDAEAEMPTVTSGGEAATAKPPPFQKVRQREGLEMRDFRRGEPNKVVPFRYRRNVRRVNLFRGMERMLEWYIPESLDN
ncbi:uncharacterized protein [Amphiura filiformis]|uniref:uncharacterized protein isoform X2 n=1 Tax=Amphiura filiformis TaxID=82378 RepID=UPI003B2158ED